MKGKISLISLVVFTMVILLTGCSSGEVQQLQRDVNELRQQLAEEREEKEVAEQRLAEEEKMAELVANVVEEKLVALEKKMAEKEQQDLLVDMEKILAEMKQQVATQSVCPAVTSIVPLFTAKVYSGTNFDSFVGNIASPWPIDFNWPSGGPLNLSNSFSVRWESNVYFQDGKYDFFVRVNEGVRLYIDNLLLIDRWGPNSTREYQASATLSAGYHYVKLDYRNVAGPGEILFYWTKQ